MVRLGAGHGGATVRRGTQMSKGGLEKQLQTLLSSGIPLSLFPPVSSFAVGHGSWPKTAAPFDPAGETFLEAGESKGHRCAAIL